MPMVHEWFQKHLSEHVVLCVNLHTIVAFTVLQSYTREVHPRVSNPRVIQPIQNSPVDIGLELAK